MQWIFMLVGLVLGALAGESITSALLGGLLGLGLGQALRLQQLAADNARLRKELKGFAERFEHGTTALYERLVKLESAPPGAAATPLAEQPVPAEPVAAAPLPEAAPMAASESESESSELVWELPEQLSPEPQVGAEASRSAPASITPLPHLPPRPGEPRRPAAPREPSPIERGFALAKAWLLGGNTVLRVGVVLLFLGLAFLLRYATEGMVVPVELRYAGVAASAIALLGLGWWLRRRNPNYGLMLQGTGIAVLYLTVFAAMRLHPLLDPKLALGLLVLVTAFSAILAVAQNALGLAVAAALGGFAAPILTSTGSGNHVALFSYFILLNAGIFAIAWFKAWRLLNLVGFVGTFGIGFAWGIRSYTPELLWSTEPFLVLFFLMYVAIGLLFARRKLREAEGAPEGRDEQLRWARGRADYVDGTVLFGPPLVGFGLQYAIVQHLEFAAAFSALGLGLFYMVLARLLRGRNVLLLMETCLALGVVFATLAIPLGLDARWTSAAWAVEGAGIYWLGLRQARPLARSFALFLQFAAALAFLGGIDFSIPSDTVLDGAPLGALMLGVALLFSFWQLRQAPADVSRTWERRGLPLLAAVGLGFLYLIAPLCLGPEGTAISWALAGLAILFAGLRLQSRTFLFSAFAIQLLGGVLFLARLRGADADGAGVLDSGWRGLMVCSLIGLALVAGMLIAVRDKLVSEDRGLMRGLSLVMLVGLLFVNLAVLFVLPWQSASAVWAGTGLLIIWLSLRLQLRASFLFGLLLQVVGGIAFLAASPLLLGYLPSEGLRPLVHAGFWAPLVLALAAQVGAWRLRHVLLRQQAGNLGSLSLQRLSQLLLAWGAAWWALALSSEVLRFVAVELQGATLLALAALSVALWSWLAARLRWRSLALLCSLLVPAGLVILLHLGERTYHPAAGFGWLGWGLLFAVHLLSLKRLADLLPAGVRSAAHVLGCWLILGVLALELRYLLMLLAEHYDAWRWLGWAVLPSAFLLAMAAPRAWPWPVAAYPREYRVLAAAPLAMLMLGWLWLANIASDGSADPLPYLPLLNPLELGMLLVLLAIYAWLRAGLPQLGLAAHSERIAQVVAGATLFVVLTATVFRAAHHWGGVPYELDMLLDSMLVQAGLSIVWTLIALPLMIVGHLRARRELWLLGAALIAVVVAKLFFVELGNRGGLERIISFIGVGVLLLVVGYFAPLPPRKPESAQVNA
ncbi:DUF2339 domain-containing protein [Pseudomonas sp. PDM15]|uniref:DUF2339 domain-containing protein n=1 Tax=Pseudomonas sp. PDM15 TaxID=2769303 RepID=UPI0017855C36|nr:DUF2339 domain-containing protein [Pseudomonas sp. PDM15]MBD9426474.1 DUF2339 domain-containing protein [Pseudomonas sp. PDM15]